MAAVGKRCGWAEGSDMERDYHDAEWGVPVHDDRALFELVTLEGAQAGLAWRTILAKRDGYRDAFAGFEPERVARLTARRVDTLVRNPAIVRHRGKIESVIGNARALLAVQKEFGSFDAFVWSFVGGAPLQGGRRRLADVPAIGPTICYAFMQAAGLVNDHVVTCPRHAAVRALTTDPPTSSSESRVAKVRKGSAASSR
jgi:DNA-3-methyladenine glycosylase I